MPTCTTLSGPIDQTPLSARDDVLCYDAMPTDLDMDIVGRVDAEIFVTSSASSFDLVVKLIDVAPDGVALLITDGMVRTSEHVSGKTHRIAVNLADTAWRLRAGHHLRFMVQSGNYPHFDANPGTGNGLGTDREGLIAAIEVFHCEKRPSFVEFGVRPSTLP